MSDVVELAFDIRRAPETTREDWESLMWAVYAGAIDLLEMPEMEIGGTLYPNRGGAWSVMIYDNVPGGAGHALQIYRQMDEVVERAHRIVASCTCSEDTCCYGCLCNYYNQSRQSKLSRGGALKILDALING